MTSCHLFPNLNMKLSFIPKPKYQVVICSKT